MKKQRIISQVKGQDKNPRKTTKWSDDRQPSRRRVQNNYSEDDPGSWKQNWEDARNVYQRPRKLKNKQTEMNNTLERINSRISEAEEWISDLEDRMVEMTVTEQNIEKFISDLSIRQEGASPVMNPTNHVCPLSWMLKSSASNVWAFSPKEVRLQSCACLIPNSVSVFHDHLYLSSSTLLSLLYWSEFSNI